MEPNIDYRHYNVFLWNRNGETKHFKSTELSFTFLEEEFEYVMILKFDVPDVIGNLCISDVTRTLDYIYDDEKTTFVILTQRKEPALYESSEDEKVYSFSAPLNSIKQLIINCKNIEDIRHNPLYAILVEIFDCNTDFNRVLVKQIPFKDAGTLSLVQSDVIIPHRGDPGYLKTLLFFMDQIDGVTVKLGVDQDLNADVLTVIKKYPNYSFYNFYPNPVGPYIIRNRLISESSNELIFFQDSDDIPCADRFSLLSDFIVKNDCQVVGSHELRIDDYKKTVLAVRFPYHVKNALYFNATGFPQLHATSVMTRKAYHSCGKFSENLTFGYDTQYLLRSYFKLGCIMNFSEFLYIRRLRPGSLTTNPETMHGSAVRQKNLNDWYRDFKLLKDGTLKLENSHLTYISPNFTYHMKKII